MRSTVVALGIVNRDYVGLIPDKKCGNIKRATSTTPHQESCSQLYRVAVSLLRGSDLCPDLSVSARTCGP